MREGQINLYSDTQTRPTALMREAIARAEVGDEQHGQDPSVNQLCAEVAALLDKEAAVFLPSGTMCNEIAILVHCKAGDEVFAHETAHILNFEGGAPAALAGVQISPLPGARGVYGAAELRNAIRPVSRYFPRASLVEVEQTANLAGGCVWTSAELAAVRGVADEHNLPMHMDGARLANAAVAAGVPMAEFAQFADSVWIDLTKGLGCPLGAVMAGSRDLIEAAWFWKQRLGGAMRQAGMMAAAGSYALKHNIDRLADDHANAQRFAAMVDAHPHVRLMTSAVETNLVFFDVSASSLDAPTISARLEERGINIGAFTPTSMRACTHLDVDTAMVEKAAQAVVEILAVA